MGIKRARCGSDIPETRGGIGRRVWSLKLDVELTAMLPPGYFVMARLCLLRGGFSDRVNAMVAVAFSLNPPPIALSARVG